ncbi:MAG: ERCC4 domain-containing protein [Deltaproteobacteria bacterium]|nr:ERCC4 domain-containing protein [Deltaproteobacteria bacterium]MBW2105771.1 ERCC4 domain-containing protein [Deltaproteobacteria bacterium]
MTLTIKIDSREQKPYQFEVPSEVGTLSIGDYSLAGLEDCIAVERKTVDDLIGCLTTDRERFEKELYKARALDYFALVIEATLSDLANGNYRSQMGPKSAVQSLLAFSIRYRLPIWFCESRKYAQRITESLLCKYAREIEKRFELIK